MFSPTQPLPPPPPAHAPPTIPARATTTNTTNSNSADMNFKAFTGGGNSDGSSSFAAARALFEAAKKPENRAMMTAAAKNPVVRNAAISAAQNPTTRNMMINAASSYGQQQQNHSSGPPALKPTVLTPTPISQDYGSSSSTYSPAKPRPTPAVYPDIMSELKALNIGRDGGSSTTSAFSPPPPSMTSSYSNTSTTTTTWNNNAAPAPAPPQSRQAWTKFADPPARPPPPKTTTPSSPKSTSPTTEAYAVVKYPHTGSHFDEITCVAGDRIVLKREVDDQWIYGLNQRTGKFGIVPIGFLDIKVPLVPTSSSTSNTKWNDAPKSSYTPSVSASTRVALPGMGAAAANMGAAAGSSMHMATALYDYNSGESGDLTFYANAQIRVLERVGSDWLEGECDGRRGIFPSNFVSCPTLASVPLQAPKPTSPGYGSSSGYGTSGGHGSASLGTVTASYDYNSGVAGDLVFYAGDVIDVVERLPDGEWIKGRLRGTEGLVPLTYVSDTSATPTHHTSAATTPSSQPAARFPPGTPVNPPRGVTAIADHHTTDEDGLYFSSGDQILVTEIVNDHWAKGKLAEFKSLPAGYFPRNYVQ